MIKDQYMEIIEAESDLFLAACAAKPLDSPVEHCGEWTMADLLSHQVMVWGIATANVKAGGDKTGPASPRPDDDSRLFEWAGSVRATMIEVLTHADPAAPAWSFAKPDHDAGFWIRRMACETVVHRWDAEHAVGISTPLAPEVASECIDEYTEVGLRSSSSRPDRNYPATSLHLHCTDTEGEWLITGDGDRDFTVVREHAKGDAAVKGTAQALLMWVWGRPGPEVEVFGDESVATVWQELAP